MIIARILLLGTHCYCWWLARSYKSWWFLRGDATASIMMGSTT